MNSVLLHVYRAKRDAATFQLLDQASVSPLYQQHGKKKVRAGRKPCCANSTKFHGLRCMVTLQLLLYAEERVTNVPVLDAN
jgi:hypothetical protein